MPGDRDYLNEQPDMNIYNDRGQVIGQYSNPTQHPQFDVEGYQRGGAGIGANTPPPAAPPPPPPGGGMGMPMGSGAGEDPLSAIMRGLITNPSGATGVVGQGAGGGAPTGMTIEQPQGGAPNALRSVEMARQLRGY